jgi:hypothetical protein
MDLQKTIAYSHEENGSTEAELVGLSDGSGQVLGTCNFLAGQGYDVQPGILT